MLTTYQYTELIVGIPLFIFFYLGFLYFINDGRKYFFSDIIISSIFFSIILMSRYNIPSIL